MSENVFIPKMKYPTEPEEEMFESKEDATGKFLQLIAQYAVVGLFGVVLIFFTPGLYATLGFDKVVLSMSLVAIVLVASSLLSLRKDKMVTILPVTLLLFWVTAFVSFSSAILSGDMQDALRGSVFETQTTGFLIVLALSMSVPLVLQGSKSKTTLAMLGFGFATTISLVYISARLILGADFLPLQSFYLISNSPIGTFNDQAIFAGLIIVMSLTTLVQLPRKTTMQYLFVALIGIALFILAVTNFFNVWIAVGFFSFSVLLFTLSRDVVFKETKRQNAVDFRVIIAVAAVICVTSVSFIAAGDFLGKKMQQMTGVNYVEVQPSFEATIGIARGVYTENAFFGIGANRFVDAWQQYKNPAINETIFWDTDFSAGSGFVPTIFVTNGILGGVLLVAFHIGLLYLGYRMLLLPGKQDPYWYYIGIISLVASCFIWGMSYVYVPGATLLILGALFTGLTFVAAAALLPYTVKTIPLTTNRSRGFFLMVIIILLVSISIFSVYTVGKQYLAQSQFNKVQATATEIEKIATVASTSYALYQDDRFLSARAQAYLVTVNQLLQVSEPTEVQQQTFITTAEQALLAAEEAVKKDSSNPDHHAVLAGVYSTLAAAGVEGANKRVETSFAEAMRLDPQNPNYHLILAQVAARNGEADTARAILTKALELKRNFTPALYLSAQLDISEGNVESAITTTRSIITMEPRNPTRYFQLGVLLSATNAIPEAIAAYRSAIALDPQYANARYLLGLAYLNNQENEAALKELRVVQETNQENQQLADLITQVESGQYVIPLNPSIETPVTEPTVREGSTTGTLIPENIDSDLVTSINTISAAEDIPTSSDVPNEIRSTELEKPVEISPAQN
ncbi:tetratricopeptide repeat protein [Candidatus Parcubacteria bacterium]|nr:tetratricopeptide repeat protein [Candidatus Parcubacteria bacterium]